MPFEKGRQKTGGRTKGGPTRKATKFVDQLNVHRFNYPKELAEVLLQIKSLRTAAADPKTAAATAVTLVELKFYYNELKSLLPYMAPKLREKEVETVDEPEDKEPTAPISDEELLKVIGDGSEEAPIKPRPSNKAPLGAGDSKPQVSASTEEDLQNLAGEQETDS